MLNQIKSAMLGSLFVVSTYGAMPVQTDNVVFDATPKYARMMPTTTYEQNTTAKFACTAHNSNVTLQTGIAARVSDFYMSAAATMHVTADIQTIVPQARIDYKVSDRTTVHASYNAKVPAMSDKIITPTFAFATTIFF